MLPNVKLRVPIILSSEFVGLCVELYQILLFFSVFLCCSNANKKNKCEYQNICNCNNFLRRVAFSDRIARVPIFLAMTVIAEV